MTQYQLSQHINSVAKKCMASGQSIEIDYRLPYVAVNNGNGDEYFFQGDEANNLIEETRSSFLHMFCPIENIILWQSQGW